MIVVVKLRSEAGTSQDVRDTFRILGLNNIYSATVLEKTPKSRDYLDILGLLHTLMRELRSKSRNDACGMAIA